MSKKYVIDLPDDAQYILINGASENHCYTRVEQVDDLEELNSDYINEHYGELQDEAYQKGINDGSLDVKQRVEGAYQRGLEDAWEAARKIFGDVDSGGLTLNVLNEVFGTKGYSFILQENTAQEAITKLKAYEDKQKDRIEVGDEVKWNSDVIVITRVYEDGGLNWCGGISQDGRSFHVLAEKVRKTGRHYDIQSILEAMRE